MANTTNGARFRLIAMGVALGALCWAFRDVRVGRVLELCAELGVLGLTLALLPQAVSVALETQGWVQTIAALGARVRFTALFAVRVATEALGSCLPAGVVFSESVKVPLLASQAGLPVARAIAAIALRKYLVLAAQAAYLLIAAAFAAHALRGGALPFPNGYNPVLVIGCAGATLALAAWLIRCVFTRANVARALQQRLARFAGPKLKRQLEGSAALSNTDGEIATFFGPGMPAELRVGGWFLLSWMFEAVETFVLLRLLGVELGFGAVLGVEVSLSLLRSLVFVIPAGIGVQDAGYALLLRALGVPDAIEVAAAFSLLKRTKELLWVGLGFALLTRWAPGERLASMTPAARG